MQNHTVLRLKNTETLHMVKYEYVDLSNLNLLQVLTPQECHLRRGYRLILITCFILHLQSVFSECA